MDVPLMRKRPIHSVLGNGVLDSIAKVEVTRGKNKWDFIKNFWASKDTVKKVRRQLMEQEKIFTNPLSDKHSTCRTDEELLTSQP
jgi:hypothetical protein